MGLSNIQRIAVPSALSAPGVAALKAALDDALCDPSVPFFLLRGPPAAVYKGGFDFARLDQASDSARAAAIDDFTSLLAALCEARKPVVAWVQGRAVGG